MNNVEIEVDGEERVYDIYVATNKNVIKAGETTAPSFLGFNIDREVDNEKDANGSIYYTFKDKNGDVHNLGDITKLNILVMTQAVQAEGFTDAWAALNDAFGSISKGNHPWIGGAESDTVKVSSSADLAAAFAAAATAGEEVTIKLENNVELNGTLNVPAGADVVLNMNGKTIKWDNNGNYSADKAVLMIAPDSSLTIDGNGTFDAGNLNSNYDMIVPFGDVTINSGTFKRDRTSTRGEGSLLCGISVKSDRIPGKLIINGGYFDGGYYGETDYYGNCFCTLNMSAGQYVRVYGGTFVGQNPAWGDEAKAETSPEWDKPVAYPCQGVFFEGQTTSDTAIPDDYTITTGTTDDGCPTYTVHYNP